MSRPELYVVNEVAVVETGPDTADVLSVPEQGPPGVPGATGNAGPNLITDATALGTLTEAVADALHLIASNAAGNAARKVAITSVVRAILQATTAAQARTAIGTDAAGDTRPPAAHTHPASAISDSTAVGRSLLTAADAAAARSAIGAGTGNGNALTSGTLAQFAATTSAELAGVLTDETGSGSAVFATSPTLTTPVVSGTLTVRQTGGTPGSNEVQIFNDGSSGRILAQNGLRINGIGSANGQLFVGSSSGVDVVVLQGGGTGGVVAVPSTGRFAFSSNTSAPQNNQVLALSLLDNNTVEINNGTRTASGGALRGLSVSTLTCPGEINTGGNYYSIRTLRLGAPNDSQPCIYVRNNLGSSYFANGTVACIAFRPNPQAATTPAIADLQFGNNVVGGTPRMVLNHNQLTGYTAILNAATTVDGSLAVTGLTTLGTYTVATLPSASANAGAFAQVTDSNSTTNGNTVAGGGANRVPVFSNGTNWIIK